jgi:flagellar hook-basal body complex protein FliE
MDIPGLNAIPDGLNPLQIDSGAKKDGFSEFAQVINESIHKLNDTQKQVGVLKTRFAAGENVELHDVMVASQEADIAMKLTMTLRNQMLEAYREVIHMSV